VMTTVAADDFQCKIRKASRTQKCERTKQVDFGALYWDRYDSGIFVGNSGSGMGLHSDQVFWSNFGENWSGHNLLALWKAGPTSVKLQENHRHKIFAREPYGKLGPEELAEVRNVHRNRCHWNSTLSDAAENYDFGGDDSG